MSPKLRPACVALVGMLAACASGAAGDHDAAAPEGEPAPAELRALCRAELDSGAIEAFPFIDKAAAIQAHLDAQLTSEAGKSFYYETLLQERVDHQGALLRDTAAASGISSCPYAGYLDFLAEMPREAQGAKACRRACEQRNDGLYDGLADACRRGCGL